MSTTERDELAEALSGAYEVFYEPLDWHETTRIADAILVAGYRKPRTITTLTELDALSTSAAILDNAAADRDRLLAAVDAILALADGASLDSSMPDYNLGYNAALVEVRAAVTDALGGDQ